MKKKKILLLFLVIAFVGLIVAYFYLSNKNAEDSKASEEEVTETTENFVLIDKKKEDIVNIEIKGKEDLKFDLGGEDTWNLANNSGIVIQSKKIDELASSISVLNSDQKVEETDLAQFGLDKPERTVIATLTDGSQVSFNIGVQTPDKNNYYINVTGDSNIYLITKYTIDRFMVSLFDIVDKTIDYPNFEMINYVDYKARDKDEVEIVEGGEINQETAALTGQTGVVSLIMAKPLEGSEIYSSYLTEYVLTKVQAIEFEKVVDLDVNDATKNYGFDNPLYFITVGDGEKTVSFVFGNETEDGLLYTKYNDRKEVFAVKKSAIQPLLEVKTFSLFQRFVSLPNIDIVDEFTITTKDAKHTAILNHKVTKTLEGEEEKTIAPTLDGVPVEEATFKTFYQIVIGLSYDYMADKDTVKQGEPAVIIEYKYNNGEPNTVDKYYNYNDNFYIVEQNGVLKNVVNKKAVTDMLLSIEPAKAGTLKEK